MSNSSKEGKKYELQVHSIVSQCKNILGEKFNTQSIEELGGSTADNDIVCIWNNEYVPIEIKKIKTPDWMQCKIYKEDNSWIGSPKCKIPNESKKIFEELVSNVNIFNGKTPPFLETNITHEDWKNTKKSTDDFNDMYIDCPDDTIKRLYTAKGCKYIQISNKGLYHLGDDFCKFNVPEFICPQKIRIRSKIHERKNSKGYCSLSITVSCLPKNINELKESNYSLDSFDKIPQNLFPNLTQ